MTVERILFLDFDGVISRLPAGRQFELAPVLHQMLLPYPDVRIVVHASMRDHTPLAFIQKQLGPLGELVVDVVKPLAPRDEGILEWITTNGITDFLILDDEPGLFKAGTANLIVCNSREGIAAPDVQAKLKSWLNC